MDIYDAIFLVELGMQPYAGQYGDGTQWTVIESLVREHGRSHVLGILRDIAARQYQDPEHVYVTDFERVVIASA